METYQNYLQAITRRLPLLLAISFVVAFMAYLATARIGPTYEVHFSYLVSLAERESAADFRFDGFYALQATDLFATTLASWVQTPEVVVAAYEEAGLTAPTSDPRQLRRAVAATKSAPQLVEVTIQGTDGAVAERLAVGLRTVMERNVAMYHDEGIPALAFTVIATDSWTGMRQVAVKTIVSAVFVVVLLLGVNAVLLWESLIRFE